MMHLETSPKKKKKMMHLDSMIIFNGVGIFDFKLIRTIMWGEGGLWINGCVIICEQEIRERKTTAIFDYSLAGKYKYLNQLSQILEHPSDQVSSHYSCSCMFSFPD